jgi:hypothetical protein
MVTTAEKVQPTLHAVYPETVYEVGMLGWQFAAIQAAWPHLLLLAALRRPDYANSVAGHGVLDKHAS